MTNGMYMRHQRSVWVQCLNFLYLCTAATDLVTPHPFVTGWKSKFKLHKRLERCDDSVDEWIISDGQHNMHTMTTTKILGVNKPIDPQHCIRRKNHSSQMAHLCDAIAAASPVSLSGIKFSEATDAERATSSTKARSRMRYIDFLGYTSCYRFNSIYYTPRHSAIAHEKDRCVAPALDTATNALIPRTLNAMLAMQHIKYTNSIFSRSHAAPFTCPPKARTSCQV
jgi:hypothetical protein